MMVDINDQFKMLHGGVKRLIQVK